MIPYESYSSEAAIRQGQRVVDEIMLWMIRQARQTKSVYKAPRFLLVRPIVWDQIWAKLLSTSILDQDIKDLGPDGEPFLERARIYGAIVVCTHRPGASDWEFVDTLKR